MIRKVFGESPAAEYKQLGLSLDELLITHPNATFIGRASGRSMEGVGIFDGDLLIVDRALTPKTGDIIVANFNGGFICKILNKEQSSLVSANPNNAPVIIREGDTFQIEGVVATSVRLHRPKESLGVRAV